MATVLIMKCIYSPVQIDFYYYKYRKSSWCSPGPNMPLNRDAIDIQSTISSATGISSLASSLTDITAIIVVSSFVTSMIAYKLSPLLSPRAQLVQLNRNIDDLLTLLDTSSGMDADHRDQVSTHLKQIQIDACVAELRLLNAQRDDVSWREYIRSSKSVYFDARACCKEIDAIRLNIMIANTTAKQTRFSLEQAEEIQRRIEPNPENSDLYIHLLVI
ncbi:hypothetical protein IW261DRAFT_1623789 [Armillaria novae-zelandiae]|uniref:Uncharacterized protein n=1 Tax=Armillaria novae-zelandiae TaxID=153914 RepID=A0AA39P9Z3_9AGAR|nr:hypothetical protein IW261DRAFT_1623789 [Armillaria novae-zelandiae]